MTDKEKRDGPDDGINKRRRWMMGMGKKDDAVNVLTGGRVADG
jgi:hypothetical protein